MEVETTNQRYAKGDQVYVINDTIGGTFFVEGKATVLKAINADDDTYLVDFGDNQPVERFVNPLAQDDPAALVARLNDSPD